MKDFLNNWYVIYTRPQCEKKIASELCRNEIQHYLPTKKTLRIWGGRRRFVDSPVFPSYVFIYLEDLAQYHRSTSIEGVVGYVKTGKEMARVAGSVIQNIRVAMSADPEVVASGDSLVRGSEVVIRHGPLTGLTGEIVRINGQNKILVRVILMNRNILVSLTDRDILEVKPEVRIYETM